MILLKFDEYFKLVQFLRSLEDNLKDLVVNIHYSNLENCFIAIIRDNGCDNEE